MDLDDWLSSQLDWLLRLCTALCGPDAAEDVAQNVVLRAAPRSARIQAMEHPRAYLRRMVVNEHLTWRRRWSRSRPVGLPDQTAVFDRRLAHPDPADRSTERLALLAEIYRLTPRQRTVIVLRYVEDLDDAGIAELLGCPPSTVRSHARRALAALRIQLRVEESGVEEDSHAH